MNIKDKYLFGIFKPNANPPNTHDVKNHKNYYPFKYHGNIFTADPSCWIHKYDQVQTIYEVIHNDYKILECIKNFHKQNYKFLIIALVDKSSYYYYYYDLSLDISSLKKFPPNIKIKYLGIDAIDIMTATSLLVNIRFSQKEADIINKLEIKINDNGLIENKNYALLLINNTYKVSNEHEFTIAYVYTYLINE